MAGERVKVGPLTAQSVKVTVHLVNHALRQRADGFAVFDCPANDLVFDIGDIADKSDPKTTDTQPALNQIKGHARPRMPDVAQVINRHAANVHADMAGLQGNKLFNHTTKRVVDAQTHEIGWLNKPGARRTSDFQG